MLPIVYTYDSMNDFSNIISKMLFKHEFENLVNLKFYKFISYCCLLFQRQQNDLTTQSDLGLVL